VATGGDIRLSFDRVPEIYDRVRPTYPPALFNALFATLDDDPQIVEVGPGSGQATAEMLERNARVTAVEIGPALAGLLHTKYRDNDRLTVLNDDFERAALPANCFDAVVSATAYHWISASAQVERPAQLLVPGGVLGVIDLVQVASAADGGYFDRVRPVYERHGQARPDWSPPTHSTVVPAIAGHLEASGVYGNIELHTMAWDQTYDAASYRDLLLSYSGTQMMEEPARTAMVDELVEIVATEFDDTVVRPLVAALTLARYEPMR